MLQKPAVALVVAAACLTLATQAHAADTPAAPADTVAAPAAEAEGDLEGISVVANRESRSVTTLSPSQLAALPPGTSIQKALNFLPGVNAQSIDALGVNEQSLSLQVRGFSTTHLGYALDGMPLGDGAYNNYNGLTISRALISENLGRADLATGIAGLGIPSTSNLGGALTYFSSNPHKDLGFSASQTLGSENSERTFLRFDTGEHAGFSAYISGQYSGQDLFVNQGAYNHSTGKQLNAKAIYAFERGSITAFADLSRTNQADDVYLSKDMLSRLGYDWGGYAPDWNTYVSRAYCAVTAPVAPVGACVTPAAPETYKDDTFTNGQILRNDNLYYLSGDFNVTPTLKLHGQVYNHTDKGAGNNWIAGWSTQGTPSLADDVPVQIRDTRYTIDRTGGLGNVTWDLGMNHIEAGFWLEDNTSSAARYIWTNVTGPFDLAQYLPGQPSTAQWVQQTKWKTQQFYVQDTVKLFDDALRVDFGFKSTYSKSDATALPGISVTPPPVSTQFATGSLTAKDHFLPQVGIHWQVAPQHELYASYAENMAMYQGGFKLGPQSVTQAVWNVQGSTLKPETSQNFDAGYRYSGQKLQFSAAAYLVNFDNRLLQYNPCSTASASNPGCGNSFHNAGSVTSVGLELGLLWKPVSAFSWYNSASFNRSTYDEDLLWCPASGACAAPVVKATAGKQQVDTPKEMYSSVVTFRSHGFLASLQGKYTGRRYYTYTNDQSFGGFTTLDLGLSYRFDNPQLHGAKLAINVTNLTGKRYAANFDNSVFAPDDAPGIIQVFHASAPRQVFGTLSFDF
jgi:iron complex outermembrane receptor protein